MPLAGCERLVALEIDDDRVVRPAERYRAFGEPIAARRVIRTRHRDTHAAAFERGYDARVIGRDDDVARTGCERTSRDVYDHRLARDRRERFARKTGRRHAGGIATMKSGVGMARERSGGVAMRTTFSDKPGCPHPPAGTFSRKREKDSSSRLHSIPSPAAREKVPAGG